MGELEMEAAERDRPQAGSTGIPYLSAATVVVAAFFAAALLPRVDTNVTRYHRGIVSSAAVPVITAHPLWPSL